MATTLHSVGDVGTKKPMFIDCRNENGDQFPYFVKVARPGQIDERHLAIEVVSSCLADRLGLVVSRAEPIGFSEPYLGAINLTIQAQGHPERLSAGWGIGSLVVPSFQAIENNTSFSKTLRAEASVLYVFDLISMHYDRHRENPNCAQRNGRLFVYDFDQCFPQISGPSILHPNHEAWNVSKVVEVRPCLSGLAKARQVGFRSGPERLFELDGGVVDGGKACRAI